MGAAAKPRFAFGDLLRQHRRAAHLTQEQLAERSGMSVRAISDLERGARQAPHRDTLRLLVEALGLGTDEVAALEAAVVRVRSGGEPSLGGRPLARAAVAPPSIPLTLPVLPSPLSSFVGREAEVAAAVHLLRRGDVRLLTLLGAGGVGKTRLAQRVAETMAPDCADGVAFVALAPLTDAALVLPTIARTLGVADRGDHPPLERLVSALRERRLLLLLDNFEQVVAAGPQVVALLQACPGVVALVTSRAALAVQGEQQLPVPPLAAPEPRDMREGNGEAVAGTLAQYPAVRLLVERVQAVKPDFAPTAANLPPLVQICRRLDGLPLAIELAAPRLKVVPPHTLLARLEHLLPTLIGGARDLPQRQQTMRATIAWSESLLTEPQRALFRRLAVFVGGCTLGAAEAVCMAPEGAKPLDLDVLEGLSRLVDHSLIQQREEDGEPRFSMLHVIREYALERLVASGEEQELRRQHCEYCVAVAEAAEPEFRGPRQLALLAQGDREHDNVRAALRWALEQGETELGLRLAGIVWEYWVPRGLQTEGRRWLDALLTLDRSGARHPASPAVRVKALRGAGIMARQQGDPVRAEAIGDECLALSRQLGDEQEMSAALSGLGQVALKRGELARARALIEESLTIWRRRGDTRRIALELGNLANVALLQHDYERAVALKEEALALQRMHGSRTDVAQALASLGHALHAQGDHQRAAALLREALTLLRDTRYALIAAPCLEVMASIVRALGAAGRAARLLGAASALQSVIGTSRTAEVEADYGRTVTAVREALGEETFAAAWAAGTTLGLEEAIAEALGEQVMVASAASARGRQVRPTPSKQTETRP